MALDRVTVLGLKEAQAVFRKLPEIAREAFVEEAIRPTASEIVRLAGNALVPGRGFRTGRVKQALGFVVNARSGSAAVGIRLGFETFTPGRTGTAAGGMAHRPTKIGHLIEFGHGGPHPAPAHPFIVPAARAELPHFLARCQRAGKRIETDMATVGSRTL